jgi:hypothetical protein
MSDDVRIDEGISRREILKRGAAAGGALMWAPPMVSTIVMSQENTESVSPPPPPDGRCHDISFISMIVDCDGTQYFVRYNAGTGWEAPSQDHPLCPIGIEGVTTGSAIWDPEGFTATHNTADGSITISLGSNCTLVRAKVFGGNLCCDQNLAGPMAPRFVQPCEGVTGCVDTNPGRP